LVIYVDFQEFNRIFISDFNIDSVTAMRQNWTADTRYNRLEVPRRRYGLLLLTDYPAEFLLPDGTVLRGQPGDLIMLSKGAHYLLTFSVPKGATTHPLLINFHLLGDQGQELELKPGVARLCRDDGSLLQMFRAAAQLYKNASPARLKAKVYELLSSLFPFAGTDECCIDYINQHYTQQFSIPALAKRCGLCETTYRKRFKELTGLSPVQYINRLKIEKACQLILTDDLSMQDISDFLHFYSLPYFYKVFRDVTGLTPMQYRQAGIQGL
jgi:AraC-like DNA-binding protein